MKTILKIMKFYGLGVVCAFAVGVHLGVNLASKNVYIKTPKKDESKEPIDYHSTRDGFEDKKIIPAKKIDPTQEIVAATILEQINEINPIHAVMIRRYYSLAISEQQRYGFPASVKLAQMLLEGGYSQKNPKGSILVIEGNNPFGIKYFGEGVPQRVQKWNELVHPGQWVSILDDCNHQKCRFVKFKGMWHAFRYHSEFMVGVDGQPSHYAKHVTTGTWEDWITALEKGGYATSKTYSQDLTRIIKRYGLHELDKFGNNERV